MPRFSPALDSRALACAPLFAGVGSDALADLAAGLERRAADAGATIVEEGGAGDAMFVVLRGVVRVVRRPRGGGEPRVLGDMGAGELFGEIAVLARGPRLATVIAASDVELLELRRDRVDAIVARHPSVGEVVTRTYRERLLRNVLRATPLLAALPEDRRAALASVLRLEAHAPGTPLLVQGEPGRGLFVLLRGSCDVTHRRADGREEPLPSMHEGDVFGELSILHGGPVTANVRAAEGCVVVELPRAWVDAILLADPEVRAEIYAIAGERYQRTQDRVAREQAEKWMV